MVEKEVREVKEKSERYALVEVIIQKDTAIQDTTTGEVFTDKGLLIDILNKLDRIEKAIG